MTARLLMIALDGADGGLLDRWSADGTLPNLTALRARGRGKPLSAPPGVTDDGLWASFQYATGLAEHGRYFHSQRLQSGRMGLAIQDEVDRDAFWDRLSARGQRVGVFDVPKCREPRSLNGIHLADWLVHGRYFREPRSYPLSLAADVVETFGPAPPGFCRAVQPPLADDAVHEVMANLRTAAARKRAAALHYLASEAWDLFIVGFKEAHCAGHALWDLADPGHPAHDEARAARLGNPMLAILKVLDAAVGELVEAAGPGAGVVVFSTSEMEPNTSVAHLMPEIVKRLDRNLGGTWTGFTVARLRRRLLGGRPALRRCELLRYNENATALRINPPAWRGRAAAEAARARMVEDVVADLRDLADADTGAPIVEAIDRPSSQAGAQAADLPDILVRFAAGTMPRAVFSPRLGRVAAEPPSLRPGNHAAGGFAVLGGTPAAAGDRIGAMEDFGPFAEAVLLPTT